MYLANRVYVQGTGQLAEAIFPFRVEKSVPMIRLWSTDVEKFWDVNACSCMMAGMSLILSMVAHSLSPVDFLQLYVVCTTVIFRSKQ